MGQNGRFGETYRFTSKTGIKATIGVFFVLALTAVTPAAAATVPAYSYASPVFGMATANDGSIFVADAGAGIVRLDLRRGTGTLFAELPGVADIAPIGRGHMYAITFAGDNETGWRLYRVGAGHVQEIADLLAFEINVNPDGGAIDSNPFEVVALSGGRALVADAGGNDLLIVDQRGNVDWIATLPDELVSTENIKNLAGCPDEPIDPEICELPDMIPAQAVATSVAVGPDGAYYVGELKGFPAPLGESRIWRIEPGTLHAQCGTSPACTVVADGFTSIVDLTFGPNGTVYVVEMDELSFAVAEILFMGGQYLGVGGTVNACDLDSWSCSELATGLPLVIAATVGTDGTVYALINSLGPLGPGGAEVVALS